MTHEETTQRTKELLAKTLKKKMEKKPLSKITVSEIIKDCNLNRRTFYYHFTDIYALTEWMLGQDTIKLVKKSENTSTWDKGVLALMIYIKENKHICFCAMDGLGRDLLQRYFYEDVHDIVEKVINELAEGKKIDVLYMEYIIRFYTLSVVENILYWISHGMKETPEEWVRMLYITLQGNILPSLKRANKG